MDPWWGMGKDGLWMPEVYVSFIQKNGQRERERELLLQVFCKLRVGGCGWWELGGFMVVRCGMILLKVFQLSPSWECTQCTPRQDAS